MVYNLNVFFSRILDIEKKWFEAKRYCLNDRQRHEHVFIVIVKKMQRFYCLIFIFRPEVQKFCLTMIRINEICSFELCTDSLIKAVLREPSSKSSYFIYIYLFVFCVCINFRVCCVDILTGFLFLIFKVNMNIH